MTVIDVMVIGIIFALAGVIVVELGAIWMCMPYLVRP